MTATEGTPKTCSDLPYRHPEDHWQVNVDRARCLKKVKSLFGRRKENAMVTVEEFSIYLVLTGNRLLHSSPERRRFVCGTALFVKITSTDCHSSFSCRKHFCRRPPTISPVAIPRSPNHRASAAALLFHQIRRCVRLCNNLQVPASAGLIFSVRLLIARILYSRIETICVRW